MSDDETVRVRHIGTHSRRKATMIPAQTEWNGYGDIQTVSSKDWEVLKRYPDLWELVTDDAPPEAPPQAETEKAAALFAATRSAATEPAPTAAPAKKIGLKR